MAMNNRFQTSQAREKRANTILRESPFARVILLLNEYHSIDLLPATDGEKRWAKTRLLNTIVNESHELTPNNQQLIRSAIKSRKSWEEIRSKL